MEIGKIHNVTIEHTPTGKYFAVLNVEFEPQPMPNKGGMIGIDVGIKEFDPDSNGNIVANPKYLRSPCVSLRVNSVNFAACTNKKAQTIVINNV